MTTIFLNAKTPAEMTRLVARLLVAALLILTAACRAPEQAETSADETASTAGPEAVAQTETAAETETSGPEGRDTYVVRAEIVSLPAPGDEPPLLMLHHEAIPEIKGVDGAVVGMDAMQMDFRFDPVLDLSGLSEGDKIELTLAVDWFGEVPQEIVAVEKLPPETELDLGSD